ncbi:TetR/AcrR family transcriptional regulator [Streptomyces albidoflavus]|uniref:TetR/AcrR family transcriptional regulator n=1 Tax=Streptomyces albidoflavus TaxID=1886 RepID=UPI00101E5BB1|nr:TetR family transcriptional regulator [Streptomyces albidoflavus]RZD77720.1 TetR family transcriptional regulator [Streptomyces albidoflavus]
MGRPKHTPNDPERRERIALAALDLIQEKGIGQVTARAVAERGAVPVASVSYYFDSVAELLREASRRLLQERSRRLERWLAASTPQTVMDDLAALMVYQLDERRASSIAAYELYVLGMRDLQMRRLSADSTGRLRACLAPLVPPDQLDAVVAAAEGFQMQCLFQERVPTPQEVAAVLHAASCCPEA